MDETHRIASASPAWLVSSCRLSTGSIVQRPGILFPRMARLPDRWDRFDGRISFRVVNRSP